MDVGRKREIIYLSLHRHHHFNVSVGSDGQSHETVSTNHNLFEENGEPKRCRTEVLPLTSLTSYCQAKPAHKHLAFRSDVLYINTN